MTDRYILFIGTLGVLLLTFRMHARETQCGPFLTTDTTAVSILMSGTCLKGVVWRGKRSGGGCFSPGVPLDVFIMSLTQGEICGRAGTLLSA